MSMLPVLKWELFPSNESHVLSQNKLLYALEGMVRANQDYLRAHPKTPLLYNSGVIYQREPPGKEEWCDVPTILKAGWGDCEDLAAWLCAELRERFKIPCRPFLKFRTKGGQFHYHALTILPHHYIWDYEVIRDATGTARINPATGLPGVRQVRKPVFGGDMSLFVFEDPSDQLGMRGKFSNEGAYEIIKAKTRDPLATAVSGRRRRRRRRP